MEAVYFNWYAGNRFLRGKITKNKNKTSCMWPFARCSDESGFYILEGKDEEGWPHFKQVKEIPAYNVVDQENF
jgi:hypothetical protein